MLEEDKNGTKPLFRDRSWKKEEREISKRNKKLNWYKSEGKSGIKYKSILFVPPTPGGILAKQLKKNREEELNRHREDRIKKVAKGGLKIKIFSLRKTHLRKKNV